MFTAAINQQEREEIEPVNKEKAEEYIQKQSDENDDESMSDGGTIVSLFSLPN